MTTFKETYKYITINEKLAKKRHPLYEQNKFMKIFIYIFAGFWAVYLMFFGFVIGQIDNLSYEIFDILDGYMIIFLAGDFILRLTMQDIPAQRAKPYKLLPIKQQYVIDSFLIKTALSPLNFFWFFFWIPFSLFTIMKFYGLSGFLMYNLGWVLLYIFNNLWYLYWRTTARKNAFIYLIPFAIYALLAYFGTLADYAGKCFFNLCLSLGRTFCEINPLGIVIIIILIIIMFLINRRHQRICTYDEISNTDKEGWVKTSEMSWLNKYGSIGEFLKLEIKSTKRNKVVRKSFLVGLACVLMFCLLFAFTDIYDNSQFMEVFICIYCFACMGTIVLTGILSAEGNYMDFLQSRKESLYYLLKAKYYYHCILLIIPFIFSLLPVLKGKFSFIEILGCMFFVSGCVFPFLFQQAIYNRNTMPLNEQIIKQSKNSKTQMFVSLIALFVPMIIMNILLTISDTRLTSLIMLLVGMIGTFTNRFWLRNIYKRFMKRRYINMEGFRSTKH